MVRILKTLVKNHMLNDIVINAGQEFFLKFPCVNGLQNAIVGSHLTFQVIKENSLQVLHFG